MFIVPNHKMNLTKKGTTKTKASLDLDNTYNTILFLLKTTPDFPIFLEMTGVCEMLYNSVNHIDSFILSLSLCSLATKVQHAHTIDIMMEFYICSSLPII